MAVPIKRGLLFVAICVTALPTWADEIQLKDGKTFYGVIVSYDNNMFKVKTDFGFILIEKSKIASIVPMASEGSESVAKPVAKKQTRSEAPKPATQEVRADAASMQPIAESAVDSSTQTGSVANFAGGSRTSATAPPKYEKPATKVTNALIRPELPAIATAASPVAPSIKATLPQASATATPAPLAASVTLPPPPEPDVPAVREDVHGNVYTNYTHGFRMYKAPGWKLIDDARTTLPNAIVAMGTFNESTLMVVGREKTKLPLDAAATTVERRLRDVYDDYRQVSEQKTNLSGLPAVEYRYRGKADEHDWSGTLVVVSRGADIFTVLGMTYADSDLIQIQENVIARTIASLNFSLK